MLNLFRLTILKQELSYVEFVQVNNIETGIVIC